MSKKMLITMFMLTLLALAAMNLMKKNQNYAYSFAVPTIDSEKQHQEFQEELKQYHKELSRRPFSASDYANLAHLYLSRAHETLAADYFKSASLYAYKSLNMTSLNNFRAYFVLADVAFTEREYNKAIRFAQNILLQSDGRNPEAFLIMARANLALGNLESAIMHADDLIAIFPSEKAFALRASILAEQGRDREAVIDFEEALKVLEDDPVQATMTRTLYARFLIARAHKSENLNKAKLLLSEALRISPASSSALHAMGLFYMNKKNYKEAIQYFKAAFKQSQGFEHLFAEAQARDLSGNRVFAKNLYEQMEELLRNQLRKERNGPAYDLIELLIERGDRKDHAEILRLALREKNQRPGIAANLQYIRALSINDQIFEARKHIRSLLAKNIFSEAVLKEAGQIEEKLKNTHLAEIYKSRLLASKSL